MLSIQGDLYIRTIKSRNGPFNVGKLVSAYGDFAVKDPLIEELDEGAYRGHFGIAKFFVYHQLLPTGALIVEQRVRLGGMWLDDVDRLPSDEPIGAEERDPIDEKPAEAPPAPPADPQPAAPVEPASSPLEAGAADTADEPAPPASDPPAKDPLAALFADLWPLGPEVKLDPTVDRAVLRQQTAALRHLGYQYALTKQLWRREG